MGCQQCKLSSMDSKLFESLFPNKPNEEKSFYNDELLSEKEKAFWENELASTSMEKLPTSEFYEQDRQETHPCWTQISKDVTRTFPQTSFFGVKANLNKFENLLRKFALYFPKVGYTQGLNFLTGYLLICGFPEKQAFAMLVKLMMHEKLLLLGLFEDNFPLNRFYCHLFWELLAKKMPDLHDQIKKAQVSDQIWIFQWFISGFLYSFPFELVKTFWDFIICKKEVAMVLLALGIVKVLRKEILALNLSDEFEFFQYLNHFKTYEFCMSRLDVQKVLSFANSISKLQIDKAISNTDIRNPYRNYFLFSYDLQKEEWLKIMKKIENQRYIFQMNPQPKEYERSRDTIEHLEKLILSKYKLYQSEYKRSSVSQYRHSNFSIAISSKTSQANNQGINKNLMRNNRFR